MDIFIVILTITILGILILKLNLFQIKNIKKSVLIAVFGIKIIAGFSLTYLYSNYYGEGKLTGDTAHYFEDGKVLNAVFYKEPEVYFQLLFSEGSEELVAEKLNQTEHWTRGEMDQFNDNRFIIRINSLMSFVSFNNLYVHVILFAFIAFIGFVLFFKAISDFISNYHLAIFLILCLFPSLLFWTSSILKESLLIFGMGAFFYGLKKFSANRKSAIFLILFGLFVLLNTKVYVLLCLLPAFIIYKLVSPTISKSLIRIGAFAVVSLVLLLLSTYTDKLNVIRLLSQKQKDFILVGEGGIYLMDSHNFYRVDYELKPEISFLEGQEVSLNETINAKIKRFGEENYSGDTTLFKEARFKLYQIQVPSKSSIAIPVLDNQYRNFLLYAPVYISNVLFLPMPWGGGSNLKWFNILENLLLFSFLGISLYFRKKTQNIHFGLLFFSLSFILLFYLLIGSTTPVVGAIVRYKTPAFLIWILFFLSIIDLERIHLIRNKKKK